MKNALCKKEIGQLSGSTLAWMFRDLGYTGDKVTYEMTDILTVRLIDFCSKASQEFETWQDVYNQFKNEIKDYKTLWLLHYGFELDEINKLIKIGKLDVGHGIYILKDYCLELKPHTKAKALESKEYNMLEGFR